MEGAPSARGATTSCASTRRISFFASAAQIVARYGSWVKMGADAVGTELPALVEQPAAPNDPDGQPGAVVPEHSWGCAATAEDLAAIRGDCARRSAKVLDSFVPGMSDTRPRSRAGGCGEGACGRGRQGTRRGGVPPRISPMR